MRLVPGLALVIALGVCAALAFVLRSPVPFGTWLAKPVGSFMIAEGENPSPVTLALPKPQPLSGMAQLGKLIFYDTRFSSSGKLACASCHSPDHFYGPAGDQSAVMGGPDFNRQGVRAIPTLMYLNHQPFFSIGPDPAGDNDAPPSLPQLALKAQTVTRSVKTAGSTAQSAVNLVPEGGFFWDGRADTLQIQALGPMLNPLEMDGGSVEKVAAEMRAAPYAQQFVALFGPSILSEPRMLVSEAMFAIARYQIEETDFHPYSSQYDAWLQGKARLTRAEMRGYILFNDPAKGDCAACHLDQPTPDGQPPLFTDHQFEALAVPRNPVLMVNHNPHYFDEGICGPYRTDLMAQTEYCGMFLTPTLRNVATRRVFFHNGVYHTLQQVMDFYNYRDTAPDRIYPRSASGTVEKYNDLPKKYWANIDVTDPPFDLVFGDKPAMTKRDEKDVIAFLGTLTDGYHQGTATQK
jgi:cytochrome c peroxidase